MKRTRHRYHYAVRCCKKEKQVIQKTKLANNIGNSKDFWQEIKKINPNARLTSNTIDEANGASEISKLFFNKYRSLYNRVPTSDDEVRALRDVLNQSIDPSGNLSVSITPTIY